MVFELGYEGWEYLALMIQSSKISSNVVDVRLMQARDCNFAL